MTDQVSAESSQPVKDMNVFSRIVGIFTSPGAVFQAIAVKPKWFVALLISLAITSATMYFMQPVIIKDQIAKTQERLEARNMDQDEIAPILEQTTKTMKITMYPAAIIGTFIVVLIVAGIWLFLSNTVLGGEANYKQMLGVVVYTGFIPLAGQIIKTPLIVTQKTTNIHFSLASFMSDELVDTFLYKFLAQIELFNIWALIATCIGVAVVAKLGVKKVWPWVVIFNLLLFAASAGLGTLGG